MTYLVLLFILLLCVFLSYKLFEKDILSPSFLLSLSFFLGTFCAFIGRFSWNSIQNLNIKTIIIIIIGVLSFILTEFLIRKKIKKDFYTPLDNIIIKISSWKMILVLLFILLTTILYFYEIKRIALELGYNNTGIGDMLNIYRKSTSLYTTEYVGTNLSVNLIVSQMRKVVDIVCFVYIYVFLRNLFSIGKKLFSEKNLINTIFILATLLICFLNSFLTGGRMKLMSYIIGGIFIYICLYKRLKKNTIDIKKILKFSIACFIPIILLFYFSSSVVGRKTNINIVGYTTFYFGSAITGLDNYVLSPPIKNEGFGVETFSGIRTTLYKFNLIDEAKPVSLKWIPYEIDGQKIHSNIFTSFRRYFNDFGYIGLIICQIIFCIVMLFLYYKSTNSKNPMYMIFYSIYVYILLDHVRDDIFFRNFFHFNTLLNLFILIFGYKFLMNFEIKKIIPKK